MNFKNMKIYVNEGNPLDEVVREFERLGYRRGQKLTSYWDVGLAESDGTYHFFRNDLFLEDVELVTLNQLKGM